MTIEGRVALVTGAAKGIGRRIALSLASAGADIVVNYLSSESEATNLVAEINALGRRAMAVRADVTNESQVMDMISQVRSRFGRLDILVNNVGHWLTKRVEDMTTEEWRVVIDSSLMGTFLCSKHVLPAMKQGRWGRIVNLAAAGAYRAHGTASMSAFYAAKAGIVAFTKALAREVGSSGITVNAVSPGVIDDKTMTVEEAEKITSKDTAVGRPGTSFDIAAAVQFLVSEEASFVTGDVLNVTGGWLV